MPVTFLALISAFLLGMIAGAAHADNSKPWSGEWQTFWRNGQAVMTLDQQGTTVTGTFRPGNGTITGEVDGFLLKGAWTQAGARGGFLFAISEDGKTFTGRYDNGQYWNGERAAERTSAQQRFTASFSPRETLRTIMAAANRAAFMRYAAAARFYEPLLEYEDQEKNARERNLRRRLLFQILNLSTFRVFDAPGTPDGAEATFSVGPADSRERYDLRFRTNGDGIWRVVVEPLPVLEDALARMLASLNATSVAEALAVRRNSPRETMRNFLDGMRQWENGGSSRALATLDLTYLPVHLQAIEGPIVADYLRQIIDRIGYVIWQEIPNDPNMPVPYLHYSHTLGDIVIERQHGAEGMPPRWVFSATTLQNAPALFAAIQNMPVAPGVGEPEPVTRFSRCARRSATSLPYCFTVA